MVRELVDDVIKDIKNTNDFALENFKVENVDRRKEIKKINKDINQIITLNSKKKMIVSHEVPRCLLTASPDFNDYDYLLPHLLDQDEEYLQYFRDAKKKGRYIIMDNSLHELGEAYDHERLRYWINEIEPDEFIVPDVWMDCHKTASQAKYWRQFNYPENTKITAVIQGKNKNEAYLCANLLQTLGYEKPMCILWCNLV